MILIIITCIIEGMLYMGSIESTSFTEKYFIKLINILLLFFNYFNNNKIFNKVSTFIQMYTI